MKEKIINTIKKIEDLYIDGKITLYDGVDKCYEDVIKVSKGKAFIITELDERENTMYPSALYQGLKKLDNKDIQEIIFTSIDSIDLYIAITK